MAPSSITAELEVPVIHDVGGNGRIGGIQGFGGDGGPEFRRRRVPARTYRIGMWFALIAIVMMFAALTSTMVVRKGASNDWRHTELPHLLYWNTLVLLASSLTLELSRRSLSPMPSGPSFSGKSRTWLYATAGLGLLFVAGQLIAWRTLIFQGVYLATNPSSSFFYLLTGAHGLHLLGGIVALFYLVFRTPAMLAVRLRTSLGVAAIYWHFMDGLWIYILLLMAVRL